MPILCNYTLVSDRMQRAINTTIEVNSPNKRIGYISASEKDMPKYLSSLMRKSYNGYHHVFFADKAPMNIDEPADEIVTYRARIENGNRNVPGEVRLTDKIPTVTPEQGERPLSNTNFTYGQVLNGEAGTDIIATIDNDTIVLTFRFPKEEKTVYFKFFEGANELPIPLIRPILVESNETSLNLSSDSFTFYGKEIYGRKTIKSGNPEYTIDPTTSVLDLQRCNNGSTVNVYVRRGWELINLNRKKQNPPIQDRGNSGHGTNVQRGGSGTKTQGNSGQQIRLSGGGNDSAKEQARIEAEKKKRLIQYGIYVVVAIVCCIGGWWGYTIWKGDKGGGENQPDESWVTKNVIFSLEDGSLNQPKIEDDNLALLDFTITSNSAKIEDGENQYSKLITYNPESANDTISVRVTFNKIEEAQPLIFAFNHYTIDELKDGVNSIVLSVKNSELTFYRELKSGKIPANLESQLTRKASDSDKNVRAYAIHLVNLKNEIEANAQADAEAKAAADAKAKANAEAEAKPTSDAESSNNNQRNRFDDTSLTLGDDKQTLYSGKNKIEPKPHEVARAQGLLEVMKILSGGEIPLRTPKTLTQQQQTIINKLRRLSKNPSVKSGKLSSDLQDKDKAGSLHRINVNIIDKESEYLELTDDE